MGLHISRAFARRGLWGPSVSALLRCLSTFPEEACLLRQLAELLLRGGLPLLAAKAAAFAVDLCPTVPRYWLTLARAHTACCCWGPALLALNGAPRVSVPFPWYPQGLPAAAALAALPVSEPRLRGQGYYSELWLPPVRPYLLPLAPQDDPAAAAQQQRSSSSSSSSSTRPNTPHADSPSPPGHSRSPHGTLSSSSSSSYGRESEAGDGAAAAAAAAARAAAAPRPRPGGAFAHRGFGSSFGLARGLDEAAAVAAHAALLQRGADKPHSSAAHAARGTPCMHASSSSSSSSRTAEHLKALASCRALELDLSERRQYAVLVSLHKRIGLRGLNLLRGALFHSAAADGGPPEAFLEPHQQQQQQQQQAVLASWGGGLTGASRRRGPQPLQGAPSRLLGGPPAVMGAPPVARLLLLMGGPRG
ncbi:hypothetical protein, conserved [Eimeria tenella]|uniref:Uncharacterized protein n=1 Tax=Eimeria tenella TaxID=5802 RepID=U6KSP9_EIMTE|nr:hypothetical protein, conserved [Eimeria tenella]CDJ38448.1 hypothetical protein, conserved [Eimeria tenella]|eukprot:XP_013229286.1 hypothetical protein, conserved [Eimeria tenella]